jgi:hypothetical protein
MKKLLLTIFASTFLFIQPSTSYSATKVGDWEVLDFEFDGFHYCSIKYESWFGRKIIDIGKSGSGVEVRIFKKRGYGIIENLSGIPIAVNNGISEKRFKMSVTPNWHDEGGIFLGDYDASDTYKLTTEYGRFLEHISENDEFSLNVYHRIKGKIEVVSFDIEGTKMAAKLFDDCLYKF